MMRFIQTIGVCGGVLAAFCGAAQQPAGEWRVILTRVQFSAEKASIGPQAARELDEVAELLRSAPAVTAEIGAHTDASGSASYNLRLSQRRAQAVSAYLANKGVAQRRLKARGYGETQPINRCRRGVRCSDAEKRQNRRVELRLRGLPADSAARAAWLQLGGQTPRKPVQQPAVPKMTPSPSAPARHLPEANNTVPLPVPGKTAAEPPVNDFPERTNENKPYAPKPLPGTFVGYTIEIACDDKPLPAGAPVLRKYEPVFLHQAPGGLYCYYIGAFFTLPEALQFLQQKALPAFPGARVVAFDGEAKTYHSP
ncbi:MAG: OmpA family protein [Saprospirales bacterium]|nr:OmpA family protein [Saprospirales bacterium]MBK8921104.1 OmpA family protein [Saprospirales bacterium]